MPTWTLWESGPTGSKVESTRSLISDFVFQKLLWRHCIIIGIIRTLVVSHRMVDILTGLDLRTWNSLEKLCKLHPSTVPGIRRFRKDVLPQASVFVNRQVAPRVIAQDPEQNTHED